MLPQFVVGCQIQQEQRNPHPEHGHKWKQGSAARLGAEAAGPLRIPRCARRLMLHVGGLRGSRRARQTRQAAARVR
jgi:hypothetical protein